MIITSEKRIKWDLFIFIVIIISAFEIPYSILVGYEDVRFQSFFNYFFSITFAIDIVLNCFTAHEKRYSGLFGWRNISGLLFYKLSPDYLRDRESVIRDNSIEIVNKQPAILLSYLSSGWFLIDFLAVFPFEIVFTQFAFLNMARTFRLTRIPRVFRMIRVLRIIKTARLFKYFDNIFSLHPALGRFTIISILIPWLAHILSCLLCFFESDRNNSIDSYGEALHFMFVTFTTNNMPSTLSPVGYAISIASVVVSFLFVGAFIGNFSSLFEGLDERKALFEEKKKEWNEVFSEYPDVYDKRIQHEILQSLLYSESGSLKTPIDKHYNLLRTLDSNLEDRIKIKINRVVKNSDDDDLSKLKEIIEEFEIKYSDTGLVENAN